MPPSPSTAEPRVAPPPGDPRSLVLARLAYLAVILLATLPGGLDLDSDRIAERLSAAFELTFSGRDVVDAVRNIVLFAGWGAVWIATEGKGRPLRAIAVATVTGALLSLSVETIQLLSATRTASVLDVMTNTAGSFAGAATLAAMIAAVVAARGQRSFVGLPAFVFAGAYGCAVLLEALLPPFSSDMIPGHGGGIGERFARAVAAFDPASVTDLRVYPLLLFPPAGALAVAALVEARVSYRAALVWVAAVVLPLFVAVEMVGGVAGLPISAGAVLEHAVGTVAGAALAARYLPAFTRGFSGAVRPALLLLAYVGVLALWSWRPFVPVGSLAALAEQISLRQLVPLFAHSIRVDYFSVADITRQFALLVPVGALLAVWPLRRRGWLSGPLPGIYVACALEGVQVLLVHRMFDMTDALVGSSAILIGWTIVRRAGMRPYAELLASPGAAARGTAGSSARTRGSGRR
ncbi:MAG: VanZ family protein [Gemmatimonadales bacterium]|nr:MAG: VanZ family protein [Gemmatimonadales bacterium]